MRLYLAKSASAEAVASGLPAYRFRALWQVVAL
jgi:hypothetical protein